MWTSLGVTEEFILHSRAEMDWPLWHVNNRHMGLLVLGCSEPAAYRKKEKGHKKDQVRLPFAKTV